MDLTHGEVNGHGKDEEDVVMGDEVRDNGDSGLNDPVQEQLHMEMEEHHRQNGSLT
jgi:hypothetical protein